MTNQLVKLLIAEDEPCILGMLKSYFKKFKLDKEQYLIYTTGEEIIEEFKKHKATLQLILMDLNLAGQMTGQQTVEQIYKINQNIPIIACTGSGLDVNSSSFFKENPAFNRKHVLSKPYKLADIKNVLEFYKII